MTRRGLRSVGDRPPPGGTFTLPDEHALFLTDPASEYYFGGMFGVLPELMGVAPRLAAAFTRGDGISFAEFGAGLPLAFERMFYSISCLHCVPQSLAQGGPGLGACWGPSRARELASQAGFGHFAVLPARSPAMAFCELQP